MKLVVELQCFQYVAAQDRVCIFAYRGNLHANGDLDAPVNR